MALVAAPPPAQRRPKPKQAWPDWTAAGWAGLAGGLVFIVLETFVAPFFTGGEPSEMPRMIAAIALGEQVLPPPTPLTGIVVVAAVAIHLPLSLIYARLLAGLIFRRSTGQAVALGLAFGCALFFLNFFVFADVFPWFARARNGVTLAAHLAYGATVAAVFKALEDEKEEL
jgi:hypothetical protein